MKAFVTGVFLCVVAVIPDLAAPAPSANYAPLRSYEGTWHVTRANAPAGSKPDELKNDCALVGIYFVCQQTVNGTPSALLVFIPTKEPGHFYTQNILPEGRATGRDDLHIEGDKWTYSSRRDQNGQTTYYRNTNVFTGRNKIHFESAESNNGTDWKVTMSGDDVRVGGR